MSLVSKWKDLVAREKEKTKNMTFKKKVEYVAGNWWVEILVTLVIIGILVGGGVMIYNSCRDHILYFVVVDTELPEKECLAIIDDFKDYLGNTDRMDVIDVDTNVTSRGIIHGLEGIIPELSDEQQKSTILVGTGLVDAYICPEAYVEFLLNNNDLDQVSNVIGAEMAEKYADRIVKDGYAIDLTDTAAAKMMHAEYKPCYLVFTRNYKNHFPDVTKAFAQYLLEM